MKNENYQTSLLLFFQRTVRWTLLFILYALGSFNGSELLCSENMVSLFFDSHSFHIYNALRKTFCSQTIFSGIYFFRLILYARASLALYPYNCTRRRCYSFYSLSYNESGAFAYPDRSLLNFLFLPPAIKMVIPAFTVRTFNICFSLYPG